MEQRPRRRAGGRRGEPCRRRRAAAEGQRAAHQAARRGGRRCRGAEVGGRFAVAAAARCADRRAGLREGAGRGVRRGSRSLVRSRCADPLAAARPDGRCAGAAGRRHAAWRARQGAARAGAPPRLHRHRGRRGHGRRAAGRASRPASSSSRATARCGAGTATPCAPARRRRRRCASASATGWPRSASRSTAVAAEQADRAGQASTTKRRCAGRGPRGREDSRVEQARAHERQVAEAARRKSGGCGRGDPRRRARARRRRSPSPSAPRPRRATGMPRWRAAPISCARGWPASSRRWPRSWATSPTPRCAAPSARRACRRSPTPRPTAWRRARCARASPSCARRWSRPKAPAIAWPARSTMRVERLGQIAQDHAGWSNRLADADGPDRRARCAARADRGVDRRARRQAGRDRGQAHGARRGDRQGRASSASRRPIGWPSARRAWARPTRRCAGRGRAGRPRAKAACGARARSSRRRKDREAVVERIVERLRCEPDGVLALAEVQSLDELPEMEKAEHRLERLVHERETMGAVNLRAEEEADELEQQITGMTSRARRPGRRHRPPAPGHPEPEPRGPRALPRRLRAGQRPLPAALHQAVRRRQGRAAAHRVGGSARGRAWRSMPARRARSCR